MTTLSALDTLKNLDDRLAQVSFPRPATDLFLRRGLAAMPPSKRLNPLALAAEWVAKITTVALEMVLPGLVGFWLDERWGTQFLGLLGFALGLVTAIWHLLLMLPKAGSRSRRNQDQGNDDPQGPSPGNSS